MKKLLVNTRYFSAPMLIFATLFGVLAGGPWVWTGVLLLGIAIIADTLITRKTPGAGFDTQGETNASVPLQNGMMYGMLGVFILLQLALAWRIWQYVNGVPITDATMLGLAIPA